MGEFLLELWSFMKERKKFWLLPIIICVVLLGSLIVFTSGSAVAPFIYTLFLKSEQSAVSKALGVLSLDDCLALTYAVLTCIDPCGRRISMPESYILLSYGSRLQLHSGNRLCHAV